MEKPGRIEERGVIALTSVLVIGMVIFAVALSTSILGIGVVDVSRVTTESHKAFAAAEACVEEATLRLLRDNAWTGGTLSLAGTSCTSFVSGGSKDRTIAAVGISQDAIRSVEADFDLDDRLITRWQEPAVSIPPPPNQADFLAIDATASFLAKRDRQLRGITIQNMAISDITIAKMTVLWDNSNLIEEIKIDGAKVWGRRGPGTPRGSQPSGTELDIRDVVLAAGSGLKAINSIRFNGQMTGATFKITFTMVDGSAKTISNVQP